MNFQSAISCLILVIFGCSSAMKDRPLDRDPEVYIKKYSINTYDQFMTEHDELSGEIPVSSFSGESFQLKSLINEETLIVRISEKHCSICVSQEMNILEEYLDKFPHRILVLTEFNNNRNFRAFVGVNKNQDNFYRLGELPNIHAEKAFSPYLMVVDSALTVKHVYMADKIFKDSSKAFYDAFKERYLQ